MADLTQYEQVVELARIRTLDDAEKAILAAGPTAELLDEAVLRAALEAGGGNIPLDTLNAVLGFDPQDGVLQAANPETFAGTPAVEVPEGTIVKITGFNTPDEKVVEATPEEAASVTKPKGKK